MQFKNILMMLTCIVVSISTFAQPNQKARVKQGIRSGEITRIRKQQLDVKDARVDA
jgi:hypothetical protein